MFWRRGPFPPILAFAFVGMFMFGGGWNVPWWLLIPFFFMVVVPLGRSLTRRIEQGAERRKVERQKERKKLSPAQQEAADEKEVLIVARDSGGVVTPATVALKSNLTTKQSEEILQRLVSLGHAAVEVTQEGTVEYRFPEFYQRSEP